MKQPLNEIDRFQKLAGLIEEAVEDKTQETPEIPEEKPITTKDDKDSQVVKSASQLGQKFKDLSVDIKNSTIPMQTDEIKSLGQLLDIILRKVPKGSLGNAIKRTAQVFDTNTKSVKL